MQTLSPFSLCIQLSRARDYKCEALRSKSERGRPYACVTFHRPCSIVTEVFPEHPQHRDLSRMEGQAQRLSSPQKSQNILRNFFNLVFSLPTPASACILPLQRAQMTFNASANPGSNPQPPTWCDTSQVLINMRWGKLLSVSEICSFLWKVKLN